MAAVTPDDVGNLHGLMHAGEALVVVGVPGKHRMRPDAGLVANLIDLRPHVFAPAVARADGVAGMMMRNDQRP
jgi:hypothetical protein